MKVLIAAETFLPEVNGVTNSVLRVLDHLDERGDSAVVVAPGSGPSHYRRFPIERVPALSLPFYKSVSVGLPTRTGQLLRDFEPDVVHLAAPVVLGAAVARAARRARIPTVAVYQTDLAQFATSYRLGMASRGIWSWLRRVHQGADLTLAPSTHSAWQLRAQGIDRVAIWPRGVDGERFHPDRRTEPNARVRIGYAGRLANEKRLSMLAALRAIPGAELVIVGDGPARADLEHELPWASFTGFRSGDELAELIASFDVFVHCGAAETFCQAIQEALASGVPVVAPASGGPVDLIRHGDNGYLWPPDNPAYLRAAVESLVRDPALRKAMAARARASVTHRAWPHVCGQLIGHYESVVVDSGRGTGSRQSRRRARRSAPVLQGVA